MPRFTKQMAALGLVLSFALTFAACNRNASGGTTERDVAAAVNGKKITMREVDQIIGQQTRGQQTQLSPLELAAARLQVLDGLVQQEVLFQRAEKEKLIPSEDEVTQFINAQKQQARMTDEDYQQMLRESNQTEQALRETARKTIAIQKLQEKAVGNISIKDSEVENYYNSNKNLFVKARGVALSVLVVDPNDNGMQDDAKSPAEAKVKIDTIYQQLKNGADFATVVRARSEDPRTNASGGNIGAASEDELKQSGFPPELVARLFNSMQVGDITEPVQTPDGRWSIFKLTGRQLQNENLTLDSPGVRDQIKEALINQRRTLLNEVLMRQATAEAKVENYMAQDMLKNSNNLSSMRPAGAPTANAPTNPQATVAPAATTSPEAK
ncbi:MAG: SurA N-terminal domain-containing protein [Pyrinomonadaceae bacterium]|nr:SurA N-terminal domain-containing protein [Acidobacteriota bacterium]